MESLSTVKQKQANENKTFTYFLKEEMSHTVFEKQRIHEADHI